MTAKQVLFSLSAFVLYFALAQPSHAAGVFEEQEYKKASEVSLKMRIYKPQGWKATDQRPAIVFFFGGGWSKGSPDQFHEHCLHLAWRGMVAMAADYRVKSKHDTRPSDSVNDARAAIRWARENAAKLGIDPKRIAVGGGSAGGHLAAATATVGKGPEVPNVLVLFNPALDLLFRPSILEKWNATEDEFRAISPFHHLAKDLPPTVIFHGTKDAAVPYESIEAFVEKARKIGAPEVLLHTYEGRPHGFFNFGRGDGKDYADTIRNMDAFLNGLVWLKLKP
jgi:acetyl esterase